MKNFITSGQLFLTQLTNDLEALGIPALQLKCDHLCFRVGTTLEYENCKLALSEFGNLLTEAPVNGRPIATFRLHGPFKTANHTVDLIELPAPKSGTDYQTGFEHAEFLISESFQKFTAQFPHLSFSEGGHPTLNPELTLKLDNRQAKFHHQSLDRVIEIENATITDIIFDFDGTIIHSRDTIYEINRIVFGQLLEREVSLEESKNKFHSEFVKLFEAFEITCPRKKEQALQAWGLVSDQFTYQLFDDIPQLLQRLSLTGVRLHLWTARDEYSARKILKHHQLEKLFVSMSFANSVHSKPHSQSLTFDWQSVPKNQILMIGDTPTDILSAKNIGAISASALWDPHAHKHSVIAAGADLFFQSVQSFENWVTAKI